jgi:nitrogen regulatory protein PII
MKKIESVIHASKLGTVRRELQRCGIHATLTLTEVQQTGEQQGLISPTTETTGLRQDRLKVELIVGDRQVPKTVEVIKQYGQVALLKVNEALQIVPPLANR